MIAVPGFLIHQRIADRRCRKYVFSDSTKVRHHPRPSLPLVKNQSHWSGSLKPVFYAVRQESPMDPPSAILGFLQLSFDDRGAPGARIRSVNFLKSTNVYLECSIPQNRSEERRVGKECRCRVW